MSADGVALWVQAGSALLTPLIAIVVAFVAYQQMATNRRRLFHELFDRRYEIYDACRNLIMDAGGRRHDLGHERFMEFDVAIRPMEFLLERAAREFASSLRSHAQELVNVEEELHGLKEQLAAHPTREQAEQLQKRTQQLLDHKLKIWKWFREQLPLLNRAFRGSLELVAS